MHRFELFYVDPETRRIIEDIERRWDSCQTYEQKPRRFKFALRDYKDFNHSIHANIFYINGVPIFHDVDESTNV